jgi:dephospho-CoA kinase
MKKSLHLFGLTGGIASGKSTVADNMRNAGVPVLDADTLGHQVLEKGGEAYGPVVEIFGSDILSADGAIDRQKLGQKVFDNTEARKKLEALTHPAISRLAKRGIELIKERGVELAFYEAALLVETGIYKGLEGLVVVTCSVENQLRRVMARDGFSKEAASARIASQLPFEEKLAVADYTISNDGDFDAVHTQTMGVLDAIRAKIAPPDQERLS